jgi:plasmid stability protein
MEYDALMSTTLTIRTDQALRQALEQRAKAQGKTVSEIVREILEDTLKERPLDAKAGHLKGSVKFPAESSNPWRKQIRE